MTTANNELATIDQKKDLAHLNELVAEINSLKEGYKDLNIEGPDDKDGYERVRAAIAVLRPKRTAMEAERKSVVKPYNDTVKLINGEYEKITSLIQEGPGGELELKNKKEAVDKVVEERKEEERRLQEKKIDDRINELLKNGMAFDGSYYSISTPPDLLTETFKVAETSIGIAQLREMSDELFADMLQMVQEKNQKITDEKNRVAEAKRKADEAKAEADKKEREEFAAKKKLLDEQEAALKKQQDEIAAQQKKIDDANKEVEQNRINGIIRHRSAILTSMGLEYNDNAGSYDYLGDAIISNAATIAEYEDAEWLNLIEVLKGTIKQKKEEAEAFLAKQKQDEKDRIEREEKERQAGLSDQQRMKEYTSALLGIQVPEFKTKKWKTVAGSIRDFIKDNSPA